jgi:spermidine synthase
VTHRRRIAALFVLSGASGLVFEVIWVRQLAVWAGHGTVAVSLVVAAFLAGMVLGNVLGGRVADRGGRLVRAYAVLEAITGATALAVSLLLSHAADLSSLVATAAPALLSALPARVALGFLVVLVPTAAMGATLPVLTRHLARAGDVRAPLGALYALNTLGAALGCGLAGFALLGAIGMLRTAVVASCANLLVAALAWSLDAEVTPAAAPPPDAAAPPERRDLVAIAAATGFAAIACEVLWFRVLHAFVRSSTYAFTLLLVVYLLGIVLGGVLYARRFAAHARPWSLLADVQSALAAATLVSVAVLGRAGSLTALLAQVTGRHADADADLVHLGVGAAIILGPATLMGVSFPLVASIGAARDARGPGRGMGSLAAANTLGGALGSLVTGLALIPAIGTQRAFALAIALSLAASLLARARAEGALSLRGDAGRSARVAIAVALAFALVPGDYLLRASTTFPRAQVIEVREGRDGTAAVLGYDRATVCRASRNACRGRCADDFSYRQLLFGTVSYASTIPFAKRYMRALAHLPMLQHESARPLDAVEVCFGTGTTAGAFTTHPSLRSLTIVDINRDVFALARHFADSNHGVLDDPRVRAVVDDGRHHLATARARWDVVSLEPPPPTAEGAATLYTREFYAAARRRMRAGGVIAQWIPLDQQSADLDRAMLSAMLAEFPHVEVYLPSRVEGVVLASDRSLAPDLARWRSRWDTPAVRASLADVGFATPESLAATRVLDTAGVRAWVAGVAPMVDDLPAVEFYRSRPGAAFDAMSMVALRPRGAPLGTTDVALYERQSRVEALGLRAWHRALAGDMAGARALAAEMRALDPTSPYPRYLEALEYNCLGLDDP